LCLAKIAAARADYTAEASHLNAGLELANKLTDAEIVSVIRTRLSVLSFASLLDRPGLLTDSDFSGNSD